VSDFWDSRYAAAREADDSVWSIEPNAWIEATVGSLTPGTAVDLAAGEGRNALWLARTGWSVTAVDFSSVGLEIAAERAVALGLPLNTVHADATAWVSPKPVDLVVIAYLQLPEGALAHAIGNAADSLAPGGTLVLIGHDVDNIARGVGGPQDPGLLLTVDGVRAAAFTLDIVECRQFERVTPNGTAIDTILIATKPT
jgi:SAM-dependent methyltransferase